MTKPDAKVRGHLPTGMGCGGGLTAPNERFPTSFAVGLCQAQQGAAPAWGTHRPPETPASPGLEGVHKPCSRRKLREGVNGGHGSPRASWKEEQGRKRKVSKRVIKEMQQREIIQERIRNVQLVSVPGNINHTELEGDRTVLKET